MTVSFHRYGQLFFPGTGSLDETGYGAGRHYTLNLPFESGLTDSQFWSVFQPVMQKVMDVYQPGAIVLQCGGFANAWLALLPDSLTWLLTNSLICSVSHKMCSFSCFWQHPTEFSSSQTQLQSTCIMIHTFYLAD